MLSPLAAAAISNQTIQESMRLVMMVRAYQVRAPAAAATPARGEAARWAARRAAPWAKQAAWRCSERQLVRSMQPGSRPYRVAGQGLLQRTGSCGARAPPMAGGLAHARRVAHTYINTCVHTHPPTHFTHTLHTLKHTTAPRPAPQVNGHFAANLDPLGLEARPHNPELDPASYGFTQADMDRE